MNSRVEISILMPVYNSALYLVEAVESVLNQTYSGFEFIIIDDGSTDDSLNILQNYALKDDRVRLISRENRGIVTTRNELLSLACGKYFAIMDSDDISHPQRLEKQADFLSNHADYFIVGCRDLLIDPEGLPIKTINNKWEHEEIDAASLQFDEFQTLNAYMAVTEKVVQIGGYRSEISYAEDRDVFLRMAEIGKVKVLPDILYSYRQHYTNTCVEKGVEISQDVLTVVQDAHKRRGLEFVQDQHNNIEKNVTKAEQFRVWAWWALAAGNTKTSLKYATKLCLQTPFSVDNWRLLICALRGR